MLPSLEGWALKCRPQITGTTFAPLVSLPWLPPTSGMGIFKGNTFFVDLQFLFAKRFISVWKSLWGLKVKTYLGGLDDRHLVSLFCWEVISQRIYSLQLHKEAASLRGKNLYVFQVERLEEGIGHIMDSPDICTYNYRQRSFRTRGWNLKPEWDATRREFPRMGRKGEGQWSDFL